MRGGNGNVVVRPPPFRHSCENENPYRKNFFCKVAILRFLMYNRGCLDLCMNNPSGVLLYITPPGKARQNQHYCMSLDNPRRGRRSMRNEERG